MFTELIFTKLHNPGIIVILLNCGGWFKSVLIDFYWYLMENYFFIWVKRTPLYKRRTTHVILELTTIPLFKKIWYLISLLKN